LIVLQSMDVEDGEIPKDAEQRELNLREAAIQSQQRFSGGGGRARGESGRHKAGSDDGKGSEWEEKMRRRKERFGDLSVADDRGHSPVNSSQKASSEDTTAKRNHQPAKGSQISSKKSKPYSQGTPDTDVEEKSSAATDSQKGDTTALRHGDTHPPKGENNEYVPPHKRRNETTAVGNPAGKPPKVPKTGHIGKEAVGSRWGSDDDADRDADVETRSKGTLDKIMSQLRGGSGGSE